MKTIWGDPRDGRYHVTDGDPFGRGFEGDGYSDDSLIYGDGDGAYGEGPDEGEGAGVGAHPDDESAFDYVHMAVPALQGIS